MGQVTIKTDGDGAGSAVLENAPVTDVERVLIDRAEGELPYAVVGVHDIDGSSVRLDVAGVTPVGSDVTVSWDGAPDAHEAADEPEADEADEPGAAEPDPEELSLELSRDELNERAAAAGVPEPEKLSNKQAVIDAVAEVE